MNPNSQNQVWSKWVWFVKPGVVKRRTFREIWQNCARFGAKAFGTSSQMQIRRTPRGYLVEVLTEGHPVDDPLFRIYMRENWERFFTTGFGTGTTVRMHARLMAGRRTDGKAADQLLILPRLIIPRIATEV